MCVCTYINKLKALDCLYLHTYTYLKNFKSIYEIEILKILKIHSINKIRDTNFKKALCVHKIKYNILDYFDFLAINRNTLLHINQCGKDCSLFPGWLHAQF